MQNDSDRHWSDSYPEFWTRAALRRRGWSTNLMRLLLGEPDHTIPNPYAGRDALPTALFAKSRVAVIENLPEFRAALAARCKQIPRP